MNALILTAVFGVIMMFCSITLKTKTAIRGVAIAGLIIVLAFNLLEISGFTILSIDTKNMIVFNRYPLLFNTIVFSCTLVYFILSGRDICRVGTNHGEYFALIFFVLCG